MKFEEPVSNLFCSGNERSLIEGIEIQSSIVEYVDGVIGEGFKVSDDGVDEALR